MAISKRSSAGRRRRGRGPLALAAGAALQYLFDPERGEARRSRLREQLRARVRSTSTRATGPLQAKGRVARDKAGGRARQAVHTGGGPQSDRELVDKVRSEVLGDAAYRDATVNVMAVDGTVTLRGQLQRPELIRGLRERVAEVRGVRRVESFLHLPGTDPPNTAEVAEASQEAVRRAAGDGLQQAPD